MNRYKIQPFKVSSEAPPPADLSNDLHYSGGCIQVKLFEPYVPKLAPKLLPRRQSFKSNISVDPIQSTTTTGVSRENNRSTGPPARSWRYRSTQPFATYTVFYDIIKSSDALINMETTETLQR
jgi:hypothetical protein